MLAIEKKGNKNFEHTDPNFVDPYAANDITIIFEGDIVKLRSINGRVVFERDGYLFSDVTVTDIGGSPISYGSPNDLRQALINLGYPFQGGLTSLEITDIDGGTP